MFRKPALSTDKLKDLGADKLAQLVLEEAERNVGFRRQVKAAMAGAEGPGAIVKVIDKRLSGLERAKSFIEWDKARAFRDDLRSLTTTITTELAPAAPALAMDRLLRFIATHERVFARVDDSSGSIQDVYYEAISSAGNLVPALPETDADLLPEKIMAQLGQSEHGYLCDLTAAVAPHLPQTVLARWDGELETAITERAALEAARSSDGWHYSMTSQWAEMRQSIASARGDLDLLITLETEKRPHMQDTLGIATKLLYAGRLTEALDWSRRPGPREYDAPEDGLAPERVSLETRILDEMGKSAEAQALRWRCFEARLSADILRDHLKALPDFEDMEAEERAHAIALAHANPNVALEFFLDWPRHDLAAKVIETHRETWNGSDWHILPKIAATMEHEHPVAATILYRALLDDILARARSKAYAHGAKYLAKLALLSADADAGRPSKMDDHATYLTGLKQAHARKAAFWTLVDGSTERGPASRSARRPKWVSYDH